jgi:hypothetical protein
VSIAFSEFHPAIWHLVGLGSQKERLKKACALSMVRMRRNEVPSEVRHLFDALRLRLSESPEMTTAVLQHVIDSLNECQVTETIDEMLRIFVAVARYQPSGTAPSMRPA